MTQIIWSHEKELPMKQNDEKNGIKNKLGLVMHISSTPPSSLKKKTTNNFHKEHENVL